MSITGILYWVIKEIIQILLIEVTIFGIHCMGVFIRLGMKVLIYDFLVFNYWVLYYLEI